MPGLGREVAVGQPRRLGGAGIEDPDLGVGPHGPDGRHRVRQGDVVSVGDDRVDADVQHHVRPLVVDVAGEPREPADQMGDERLRRAVDRERAEFGRSADGAVQGLDHLVTGGVHAEPAAEVDADRFGAVPVDDRPDAFPEVVEARLPGRRSQLSVDPHHRPFDAVGMVMDRRERATLRTGVAVRHRVVLVAPDPDDRVPLDIDEDAADRGADPAEAVHRPHVRLGHLRLPRAARVSL